jgi:hypothetical protein
MKSVSLWKWEIAAAFGSILLLIAIVAALVAYNGKPIISWHGVTLNAVVSLLSTTIKVALFFTVSQSIGQWRLILFTYKSRPLIDLDRVDAASRGPLGSAKLMRHLSLL